MNAQKQKYTAVPGTVPELSTYSIEGQKRFAAITGKLMYNDKNEIVFSFGKHKGERVIDNADYAGLVLCSDFPVDTKTLIKSILRF